VCFVDEGFDWLLADWVSCCFLPEEEFLVEGLCEELEWLSINI
jgi:hypothetical protein